MSKDIEMQRAELWCAVYVAYVSAPNSVNRNGAASWADTALEEFDRRFKNAFAAPRNPRGLT